MVSEHAKNPSKQVTEARAAAQRTKLNAQAAERRRTAEKTSKTKRANGKQGQRDLLEKRRAQTTMARAIEDYLADHEGSNHSPKTLQWHQTALGLLRTFLEQERGVTLVGEVDAADLSAWFAALRKTPGSHGKPRAERTVQTYARSARAFLHWLVRREIIERSLFDKLSLPKVGKPLIRIIEPEKFEQLLLACTPPGEMGPLADRAAARNRAILWLLYDTGIRLAELCNLRLDDFDRKHGTIIVKGKGAKERRIALGNNCLRNLLYYLDRHRPDEEELAQWGSAGEDHLFLSETRLPLTKNGVSLLVKRVLLGDAGYCPALLTGQGSTLAMMGAYILAGELKVALGNHQRAFAQYEQAFRPVVIQEQKKAGSNASILVPATPLGLWAKTHLFPLLVPPLLVAIERGRRLLPMFSSRPSRLKDYGDVLPPS